LDVSLRSAQQTSSQRRK